MIVRVNVVLNRTQLLLTMTGVLATYAVVIFRVKVRCITLVDGFKLWSLIWLVNWVAMLLVVYSNRVVIGINEDYHQLTWYNSLWLWRWLPHSLSKCQSLSTTVLFRSLFFFRLFVYIVALFSLQSFLWTNYKMCENKTFVTIGISLWNFGKL